MMVGLRVFRVALLGGFLLAGPVAIWGQAGCGLAGAPPPLCPPVNYHSGAPIQTIGSPRGMNRYKQKRARAALRQVRRSSARLLALARQLRAAADKANDNDLSLVVIRKAKEIEVLARRIQRLMGHG